MKSEMDLTSIEYSNVSTLTWMQKLSGQPNSRVLCLSHSAKLADNRAVQVRQPTPNKLNPHMQIHSIQLHP